MNLPPTTADTQLMKTETSRERRAFFAVHDGRVSRVVGYSCAPQNPDYFWCPQIGFSLPFGKHLFNTEGEALTAAIKELELSTHDQKEQLAQLRKSLSLFQG